MKLKPLFWLIASVCVASIPVSAQTETTAVVSTNTAIVPTQRTDEYAIKRREQMLERAKEGHINVVFLGDSITDFWRFEKPERGGRIIWDQEIAPLGAANFGVSADRTQHVLWRIQQGDLDNLHPKALVLMIGTNNTGFERDKVTPRNSVPETIEGVTAIINELKTRLPETKILFLAIFPRNASPDDPQRQQVNAINDAIQHLADGDQVRWLNINDKFLQPDGTLTRDIMPDLLHPGAKGYRIWMDAIHGPLMDILNH